MNRIIFFFTTLLGGLIVQVIFRRYLSFFGTSADVLLLVVVASGFMLGPLAGETMGFIAGLISDALGVSLFGIHTLLFSVIGYAAGKLRHHVDSERPAPQVVIALVATLTHALGLTLIQTVLEEGRERVFFGYLFIEMIFNSLMAVVVFWLLERWVGLWRVDSEHS